MRTVIDAIAATAAGPGSVTVVPAGDAATTHAWSDVHLRARRMASVLGALGIGRNRRVALLGDTSIGLVVAIQAVWLTGAAVTVIPPPTRAGRLTGISAIVADARPDLLVSAGSPLPAITTPVIQLSDLERCAAAAAPARIPVADPGDLAVLQYTSGSTSAPRGVPVTHRHLAAQLLAIRAAVGHDPADPDRLMSWLPLHHDLGLVGFLAHPMSAGSPLVLQSPAMFVRRPASWLEALSRHRSTLSGGPDFAYRVVTPLLEAGLPIDLRAVRVLVSGGEPIDPAAMRRFVAAAGRHGLDPRAILPGYGLAEATMSVACSRAGTGLTTDVVDPHQLERARRAVPARPSGPARGLARLGPPVSGVQLRIVDPDTGAAAGDRQVGEVQVRGASVIGHYWGEPAPPAGTWLRTGDLGYLAEGELVLCGRRKDVVFAAGRNLYPPDIESAAGRVAGVRPGGALAFGAPGELGDRLVVLVEARAADRPGLRHSVAVAVAAETGVRPADVLILPPGRLPRTTSGKLRRAEARRRYLANELATPVHTPEGTHR